MIVGLFIKNVKCYKGLNFIPLSYKNPFCGLVGKNGVGKSAVMESLDYIFNDRETWNIHYSCVKAGSKTNSQIIPLFLISKEELSFEENIIEHHNQMICSLMEKDLSDLRNPKDFISFRDKLIKTIDLEKFVLISVGLERNYKGQITVSTGVAPRTQNDGFVWKFVKESFEYVYIPKDIDPSKMTLLQTDELQTALGQTLESVVSGCLKSDEIKKISLELKKFTSGISNTLGEYEFKESWKDRQSNLKPEVIYKLIIKDFFSRRRLNKRIGRNTIDISSLSSGEKQQAIIELYYNVVKNSRKSNKKLILGIDEPESSLHVSACYSQFERLYDLCSNSVQIFFSAHWYGFIPTLKDGCISNILYDAEYQEHGFSLLEVEKYLEQGKSWGQLEIELKSNNDFVQSIVSSISKDDAYNWLICEGYSDKLYLDCYLKDLVANKNLRIVAVRGFAEIQRVYELLKVVLSDTNLQSAIKGKIFLLSDTDEKLLIGRNKTIESKNPLSKTLLCKRLVSENEMIKYVNVDDVAVSSADIEASVNGILMKNVLTSLQKDFPNELSFINNMQFTDKCVKFAADWTDSARNKFKSFLKKDGVKTLVAAKYAEIYNSGNIKCSTPEWITNLTKIF